MNAIELEGVSLGFGGRRVLEDVTLSVASGAFIGLLGPNGAGKTTLLRALLGLLKPEAGSIRVLGRPVRRGLPNIGYMPQVRSAPGRLRLSGREMLETAADGERWGLPFASRAARREAEWALAQVGATGLAERPIGEMSGGERQRLLLAQALLGRPRLLLLDEPLISLDPGRQRDVVEIAARLRTELGVTVLFSAHELNPLLGAIDRVIYLGNGQAAVGTVDEVATGPVLSRLYGTNIEVVRAQGRIFVLADGSEVEGGGCGGVHGEAHAHVHV